MYFGKLGFDFTRGFLFKAIFESEDFFLFMTGVIAVKVEGYMMEIIWLW